MNSIIDAVGDTFLDAIQFTQISLSDLHLDRGLAVLV
jgi:hypothetical protein